MKQLWCLIACLLLWGCASTTAPQSLTLFFSPEQITLNSQQQDQLRDFFASDSYQQFMVKVAPADLDDAFNALVQGQLRLKAITRIATEQTIPLQRQFAPQQLHDTLIIERR